MALYPSAIRANYQDLIYPDLIEGMIVRHERVVTVPNASGKTARVQTITPGVSTQEITTYKLKETVTGILLNVTSDSTPTAQEVSDLIRAAIIADPVLNGLVTVSGTTTVVITARQSGGQAVQFNFVDNGSGPTNVVTVAVTTAGSDGTLMPMGRALTVDSTGKPVLINAALSGSNIFAGISCFDLGDNISHPSFAGNNYYDVLQPVSMMKKGEIAVYTASAVDPTKNVYAVYSGAFQGQFAGSSVANSSQITSGAAWKSPAPANSLAVLVLNLP